ncbi:hypothetical protein MP638_004766 [Amoeboaphelidium occidentale]|nr:hypothetical protein MP638_004766 [Amoeboaphelidium occidentale]
MITNSASLRMSLLGARTSALSGTAQLSGFISMHSTSIQTLMDSCEEEDEDC